MKLSSIFNNIYTVVENRDDKLLEVIAFILYVAGIICLACFHEPWFDEFQALQIAKSSVHDILFVIPHMEGHPPLWHLILKFTSIFTSNPEVCIKIPNIIFASMAAFLLIFKSPFSRIIRLILPFTYFIFYQFGVINRPYSIFMLALFLIAYIYPKRNEKPFRFGLSLGLLCLSSAYGIILAFGITLVWLIEIWNKQQFSAFIKSFVTDKRFYSMLFLFILCLFIFFELYPVFNDIAYKHFNNCPLYQQFLYCFFGFIADATFANIANISNIINYNLINVPNIIAMCIGLYITIILFRYFLKRNFLLFLSTYLLWIVFAIAVYFYVNHIGLLTLLLIFNFWCSYFKNNEIHQINIDKYLKSIICITLIVQIYWSISAFYHEVKYNYSHGKQIATYLKNNNIASNYKLFCLWGCEEKLYDENGKEIVYLIDITQKGRKLAKIVTKHVFCNQPFAVEINTYFDKNIFYNFNVFNPNCMYALHYDPDYITEDIVYNKWKSYGEPDIIFAPWDTNIFYIMQKVHPQLAALKFPWQKVYGDKMDIRKNYIVIKTFNSNYIWKSGLYGKSIDMYVKKSLFDTAKLWK